MSFGQVWHAVCMVEAVLLIQVAIFLVAMAVEHFIKAVWKDF